MSRCGLRVEPNAKPLPPRKGDSAMEGALSKFFAAALSLLRREKETAKSIPGKNLHIPEFKVTNEPDRWGLHTSTKIELVEDWTWFVLHRFEKLRELPELKAGLEELRRFVEIDKFYGCDQAYFFNPVIELIETARGLDVPGSLIADAAKGLAEELVTGEHQVETVGVLKGFFSEVASIRLDDFEIRNYTDEECRAIWEEDGKAAEDHNSLCPGDFVAKVYGHAKQENHGKEYWEYLRQLQKLAFCLRLFKPGKILIDNRPTMRKIGWSYSSSGNQRLRSAWMGGKPYRLIADEIPQLKELWQKHSDVFDSPDRRLGLAIRRFNAYYERETPEDGIIDTFIGLEALLVGSEHEITYKLSLRAANLMGDSTEERDSIFRDMKAGYKLRSAIVHGDDPGKKARLPSKQAEINLKDFGEVMNRYLAKAIMRVDALQLKKPESDLVPYLDKLALK